MEGYEQQPVKHFVFVYLCAPWPVYFFVGGCGQIFPDLATSQEKQIRGPEEPSC